MFIYHQFVCTLLIYSRRPLGESRLDYKRMARTLRRYTNPKYPAKPKNTSEIKNAFEDPTTMMDYGMNLRKTYPFYINTVETKRSAFTVFASHEMIRMVDDFIIPENRRYMVDGTFNVVPFGCGFYQLLVIAIEYKRDVSGFLNIFSWIRQIKI